MSSPNVKATSDANFEKDILGNGKPAIVDFWAVWCAPCRAVAPVLDELAEKYKGKFTVAKVNVDENQMTPTQYNVRGIPTLLLFKGGKVQEQIVGAASRDTIENMIKKHL